jgi:hypothetical protein
MRAWWSVAVVVLGWMTAPLGVEAQEAGSRALGSPVPRGTVVERPAASGSPEERPGRPAAAPSAYEEVAVPPPPASTGPGGVRYPRDHSPLRERVAHESGLRIPSGIATRLRALDSDFQVLAVRGGSGIVDGILSILAGGLSITMGFLIGDYSTGMSPYLYVYGGANALRGLLDIVLVTNPSGPAIAFAHMPMTTMEEVQQRLEFGERELAGLADRARLARILDGSINVAAGLTFFPMFLGINGGFPVDSTIAWFVMVGAAVSAISGVITLLSTSEAERRWSAYEELRDRLVVRGEDTRRRDRVRDRDDTSGDEFGLPRAEGLSLSPLVAGGPEGGVVHFQGRF